MGASEVERAQVRREIGAIARSLGCTARCRARPLAQAMEPVDFHGRCRSTGLLADTAPDGGNSPAMDDMASLSASGFAIKLGRASLGKECVSTCRSRGSPFHYKKKK